MKRFVVALVAITLYGVHGSAADGETVPTKKAWEWTPEERVAARFAPEALTARKQAFAALTGRGARAVTNSEAGPAQSRLTDYVEGATHPELLLPTEILTTFIRSAYAQGDDDVAKEFRNDAARKAAAVGLPAGFLMTLESELRAVIDLQTEEERVRAAMASGDGATAAARERLQWLQAEQCPLRTTAIARLRRQFGAKFDEFLYTALAPNMVQTAYNPTRNAAFFLRQEGGCQ